MRVGNPDRKLNTRLSKLAKSKRKFERDQKAAARSAAANQPRQRTTEQLHASAKSNWDNYYQEASSVKAPKINLEKFYTDFLIKEHGMTKEEIEAKVKEHQAKSIDQDRVLALQEIVHPNTYKQRSW